jgi:hypothetical protein
MTVSCAVTLPEDRPALGFCQEECNALPRGTMNELTSAPKPALTTTFAPGVITTRTIAHGFTFDAGFELAWIDGAGPVTEGDRALAQKEGAV